MYTERTDHPTVFGTLCAEQIFATNFYVVQSAQNVVATSSLSVGNFTANVATLATIINPTLNNVTTTVIQNSANWTGTYTTVRAFSSNWQSTYTNFSTNSANYILDGGNIKSSNLTIGTEDAYHLNFETYGTTKITILSSGEIGIGTAAPDAKLNIVYGSGVGETKDALRITQTGAGNALVVEDSTNPDATPFTVKADGSVGIGTTTPNRKLTVIGGLSTTGASTFDSNIGVGGAGDSTFKIDLLGNSDGIEGARIYNSNPGGNAMSLLLLGNNENGAAAALRLNSSTNSTYASGSLILTHGLNYPIIFATQNTERMRVTGGGSVGINTQVPNERLTVSGNISASNIVYALNSSSTDWTNAFTNVQSNSANWSNVFTNVQSNSGNWQSTYTTVRDTSSNWQSTYTTVRDTSSNWSNVFTNVQSNSANWQSTYQTVCALSAQWASNVDTGVRALTSNWQNTYIGVSALSAQWASNVDTGVRSLTSNWESTYTTFTNNSANYILQGGNTLTTNLTVGTTNTRDLIFETNNLARMVITSAGNIGIGVTVPSETLTVNGNISASGIYRNSQRNILISTNFSASADSFYLVNTSSGVISATLPSTPLTGDSIKFSDPFSTWNTNLFVVNRNGNSIERLAENLFCDIAGTQFILTFVGSSVGWRVF